MGGSPAIVAGWCGRGRVVLVSPHPEDGEPATRPHFRNLFRWAASVPAAELLPESAAQLEAQAAAPERIIVRTHVQRAGKSAALMTGLRAVSGRWTQLLDGDGQNDIADTRRLWDEIVAPGGTGKLGLIAGKRKSRNDSGFKWLQSRVANGIRRFMLRDDATDTGCGWKLMRTDAFRELPYFASMHRFLPALMKRAGWAVREELVNDRRRWHGTPARSWRGWRTRCLACASLH